MFIAENQRNSHGNTENVSSQTCIIFRLTTESHRQQIKGYRQYCRGASGMAANRFKSYIINLNAPVN